FRMMRDLAEIDHREKYKDKRLNNSGQQSQRHQHDGQNPLRQGCDSAAELLFAEMFPKSRTLRLIIRARLLMISIGNRMIIMPILGTGPPKCFRCPSRPFSRMPT